MAEEDLIFGKNRHLFGGIEPSNMKKFSPSLSRGKVYLDCQLPDDTVIDGQKICSVAGAVIRRKMSGYPVDEFDGDLVADIKVDELVMDADASAGNLYYYAAFPYSTSDVYSRNPKNRTAYDFGSVHYIYGYDLDLNDSNPATRVSYPNDVLNAAFDPAKMDYSVGTFDYGGWTSVAGKHFMPRPCMLTYTGTVDHYLNPDDYTKKYNSTEASDVSNPNFLGNAMMEWPKIYMKREEVNGVYRFRCSDTKVGDDWDCWCNYDINDNQIDHFYTSIYPGTGIDENATIKNVLRSISGQTITTHATAGDVYIPSSTNDNFNVDDLAAIASVVPYDYFTRSVYSNNRERTYDGYNIYPYDYGKGWTTELLADRLLIQDLLVMMAKTTDCQAAYGMGAGENGVTTNGTLDKKGLFWGSNGTTSAVKVFGMENWWGNMYRLMDGLYYKLTSTAGYGNSYYLVNSSIKYKMTAGKHDHGDGSTGCQGYHPSNFASTSYLWLSNSGHTKPTAFDGDYKYLNLDTVDATEKITGGKYHPQTTWSGWIQSLSFVSSHGRLSPFIYDTGKAANSMRSSLTGSSTTYECDYGYIDGDPINNQGLFIAYVGYSSVPNGSGPFSIYYGELGFGYTSSRDTWRSFNSPPSSCICASIAYK